MQVKKLPDLAALRKEYSSLNDRKSKLYEDLEQILELYEPLIRKHSLHSGTFNEDLHQYLLIHIALNINKFPL